MKANRKKLQLLNIIGFCCSNKNSNNENYYLIDDNKIEDHKQHIANSFIDFYS